MILKTKTMVLVMLTKVKMVNFIKIEIKDKKKSKWPSRESLSIEVPKIAKYDGENMSFKPSFI